MARVRQVQMFLSKRDLEDTRLNKVDVVHFLQTHKKIVDVSQVARTDGGELIIFHIADKHTGEVLEKLQGSFGVGNMFGRVDVIALQSTRPRLDSNPFKPKQFRTGDRMSTEEIYELVDSNLHLTFDFLSMLTVAALIAAVGLITDSAVLVVAAMVISPLMGPILGITFGTAIGDKNMVLKSIRNECIGVVLIFFIGISVGLIVSLGGIHVSWGQPEMMSRGTLGSLYAGIAVAIPSGIGVGFSISGGGIFAMTGIAISASLLPPVVNSGLNVAYGSVLYLISQNSTKMPEPLDEQHGVKWLVVAGYSFSLWFLNLILIFVTGLLVFKVKKIKPLRFHTHHIEFPPLMKQFKEEQDDNEDTDTNYNAPIDDDDLVEPDDGAPLLQ